MKRQQRSFQALMAEVRAGSDEAASDLVEMYGPHVMRTVRRNLARDLRGKFDSEDFAQAVWASFFSEPWRLTEVKDPKQLIALLAAMARNKVIDEVRRRTASQKYNVRMEKPLCNERGGIRAVAPDPTPSQLAIARERWKHMLRNQSDKHRQVIRWKLMGRSHRSIAARLNLSERTVQRVIQRLTRGNGDAQ